MRGLSSICFLALVIFLGAGLCDNLARAQDASHSITLDQCMDMAYRNSPELAEYGQRVRSAEAALTGAYGNFLPSLSTGYSYDHQYVGPKPGQLRYDTINQQFFYLDPIASRNYETYNFSISGNWTLFSGLSRFADVSGRKQSLAASEADLEQTRLQLESRVIRAYYGLVQAQMLVTLQNRVLEFRGEEYEQTVRAFTMGAVARSDTLRTSVRYAEAKLALLEAENDRELANLTLATVVGLPLHQRISAEEVEDPDFADVDRDMAVQATLGANPQLRASEMRVAAAKYDVKQAKGAYWPSVGASYRYSWYDLSSPPYAGVFFDENYSYVVSLGISWDIFDQFRRRQNTHQAQANARIQEYMLIEQRRDLVEAVESTLVTIENSRKRVDLARATIELAMEDLRLAQERYRVGAATLLDITEAEVSVIEARASEIDGITQYLIALAELEQASGLSFGP